MKLKKYLIAIPMVLGAIGIGQVSHASDYGCTVLLCLSDPRGPRTESECRPPIDKLFRDLAKGRGFPSCAMAGSSSTGEGSFAKYVSKPFDVCPTGLTPKSGYIAKGDPKDYENNRKNRWRYLSKGTHAFSDSREGSSYGESRPVAPRACVKNHLGSYTFWDDETRNTVNVYEEVVWQKRHRNPRAIDVYIDSEHYKRVRW